MTYHQTFDRLGNPCARPARSINWHRIFWVACGVLDVVLLALLVGGPRA